MGVLAAEIVKQLITQILIVPPTVMGRHTRHGGRTVIPFIKGYHALHARFLARGHEPRRVRNAIQRDNGCPNARHVWGVQPGLNGRAPRAVSIADPHARADQLGAHDLRERRHGLRLNLFTRMQRRDHAVDSMRAQRDRTHGVVRHLRGIQKADVRRSAPSIASRWARGETTSVARPDDLWFSKTQVGNAVRARELGLAHRDKSSRGDDVPQSTVNRDGSRGSCPFLSAKIATHIPQGQMLRVFSRAGVRVAARRKRRPPSSADLTSVRALA